MINDPMSQMAQAQKLTIPQLQQALRNGTIDPQVGQIVLASKIKQSKDAKAAMAAQMPKQPPVAQQNMAYGQGVDTLATNLPAQGMAAGGIIAFNGTDGSYVSPNFSAPGLSQADVAYAHALDESFLGDPRFGQTLGTLASPGLTGLGYATDAISGLAWVRDPRTGKLIRKKDLPKLTEAEIFANKRAALDKELQAGLDERAAFTKQQQQERAAAKPAVPAVPASLGGPFAPNIDPVAAAEKQAQLLKNRTASSEYTPYRSAFEPAAAPAKRTGSAGSQGIADGYKIAKYDTSELKDILESEMNPATKKPWTYEEKAAERLAQLKELGYDPDTIKKQREELEKRKEKSAERSKLDSAMPWFAASEAFGRAKAGDTGISSIASALGAYGKSAIELDEKEQARLDKIRTEGNALALAQNAEVQAQYSGNKAELKEAQSAVKAARTNLANVGFKTIDQQNEVAKTVYETQAKKDIAAMQEAGADRRYGREERTIANLAGMIKKDAWDKGEKITDTEATNRAYQMSKFQGSMYGADTRTEQTNLAEYRKWLGDNKFRFIGGKEPPSYQQWLVQQGLAGATNSAGAVGGNAVDFSNLPK